ncbi:MAG: GNAT family N-acetyltransferase [Bacteroidota bacterium]
MKSFPELQTARLCLNQLQAADIPRILRYANEQKIADMTQNIPHPYSEESAIFWINNAHQGFVRADQYTFAIRLEEDRAFIGGVGLRLASKHRRAELGYWLALPFWGQGYMTEAVAAVLQFGFEQLKLHKIHATHLEENLASGKVMQKCGMQKEAILVDHIRKGGRFCTLVQYRLTQEEYQQLDLPPRAQE